MDQETDILIGSETGAEYVDPDTMPDDGKTARRATYRVMRFVEAGGGYVIVGDEAAHSAHDAIESLAKEAGHFAAVALRSWKEADVEIETVVQAKIVR